MEERHRVRHTRRAWELPCPLPVPLFLNLHMFTNLQALWILSFGGFIEVSRSRHDWLNHWPSVIELSPSACPLWTTGTWKWKFQPSNHKVGTRSNQPSSSGASKSYLINKRHLFVSHHLGNFSGFRSSVPEMGMKNKRIYFYYRLQHHSIYLLLLFS